MANDKKTIKVRDLKPNKDAKGGGSSRQGAGRNSAGRQGGHTLGGSLQGGHTLGASKNTKQHQGHGGSGHS